MAHKPACLVLLLIVFRHSEFFVDGVVLGSVRACHWEMPKKVIPSPVAGLISVESGRERGGHGDEPH